MKALLMVVVLPLAAQTPSDCLSLRHHGKPADACFAKLAASHDPYFQAEGLWGLGRYEDANVEFRAAVARQPQNPEYRVRWGRLFLDHWQTDEAAKLFGEALTIRKDDPGALLGMALVAADGFENKAVELARKAIAADPKLVEAQELLARLALEDGDEKRAAAEADKALAMSPEALDALAIHASMDWLSDRARSPWMDRILAINPVYGEAYATGARFFVLNRRYEEGIEFYRKALELNPKLWPARSELGINLMRLGREDEARRQLKLCYDNGFQDYATVNALRLLDKSGDFVFLKAGRTVLKLNRKEADVLRPYFQAEMERAMAVYDRKYQMRLEHPVQVEVYPNHEDFAVRTLGMPGLGALGVTFGYVVAMDSPSARKPGEFHWASTLWHELSHVYVLTATGHRVPRWFTEGVAVHEETATSPDWGDRLSPDVILAIRDKKLLPVEQLDRGFVRPTYPAQVVVSYFEAGRLCDYIAQTWGEGKLLDMIHAFAAGKTTPEAIQQALSLQTAELDRRFLMWLDSDTKKTVSSFEDWRKRLHDLIEMARAGKNDDVIRLAPAVRDLYPDYVEAGNAYDLLAEAWLAKQNKANAAEELEHYSRRGGRDPALVKKLAALLTDLGRKKEAAEALERLIYVVPLDEEVHSRLGDLYVEAGNGAGAVREYTAVIALKPQDPAASHFNLARAYRLAKNTEAAKDQLLLALEAAPGYRPAQRMLLELSR